MCLPQVNGNATDLKFNKFQIYEYIPNLCIN